MTIYPLKIGAFIKMMGIARVVSLIVALVYAFHHAFRTTDGQSLGQLQTFGHPTCAE
jgi:hypothetical protein